jgi:hypothetical protein
MSISQSLEVMKKTEENNLEINLQKLDVSAFEKNGEIKLQPTTTADYEDAEDRICAYWDKAGWVIKELGQSAWLHPKMKQVLGILSELLDSQCRQEYLNQ